MTMTFFAADNFDRPRAQRKINEFRVLPAGWHYGNGVPIGNDVALRATDVVGWLVLCGVSRTDAFPGADGDVQVTGYYGQHFISVEVNLDGTFSVTHEIAGVEHCSAEATGWLDVKSIIHKVSQEIWGTSGYFIQSIGIPTEVVSQRLTSRSLQTADFRLLSSSALSPQAA